MNAVPMGARQIVAMGTLLVALLVGAAGAATAGPAAIDYTLTSYDASTGLLTGVNKLVDVATCSSVAIPTDPCRFSATISADTRLLTARLDRYSPTDPCRTLAEAYNT